MKRRIFSVALALGAVIALPAIAAAQDFQKTYTLGSGGRISIHSSSGNVSITGYDGNDVAVAAYKQGRDADLVEIEDLSTQDRVDVRTHYPSNCHCRASVRFEVRVPRSVKLVYDKISSSSGDVEVSDVAGDLRWHTEKLGFEKKAGDSGTIPGFRWLTVAPKNQQEVVSPSI